MQHRCVFVKTDMGLTAAGVGDWIVRKNGRQARGVRRGGLRGSVWRQDLKQHPTARELLRRNRAVPGTRHDRYPTMFGIDCMNDGNFVPRLRCRAHPATADDRQGARLPEKEDPAMPRREDTVWDDNLIARFKRLHQDGELIVHGDCRAAQSRVRHPAHQERLHRQGEEAGLEKTPAHRPAQAAGKGGR